MKEPKGLAHLSDNLEKLRNRIIDLANLEQKAINAQDVRLLNEVVEKQNRIYLELAKTKPFHIEE